MALNNHKTCSLQLYTSQACTHNKFTHITSLHTSHTLTYHKHAHIISICHSAAAQSLFFLKLKPFTIEWYKSSGLIFFPAEKENGEKDANVQACDMCKLVICASLWCVQACDVCKLWCVHACDMWGYVMCASLWCV